MFLPIKLEIWLGISEFFKEGGGVRDGILLSKEACY